MKENILFILLLFAGWAAIWFVRGNLDEKDFAERMRTLPVKRDSSLSIINTTQPERRKEIFNVPKKNTLHEVNADSIFKIGIAKGWDSAAAEFVYYTAMEDTTISFDTLGTLHHTFDPLTRMATYAFLPMPLKTIERTITDSVFVPGPPKVNPWWHTPAYIAGGIMVGWILHDVVK